MGRENVRGGWEADMITAQYIQVCHRINETLFLKKAKKRSSEGRVGEPAREVKFPLHKQKDLSLDPSPGEKLVSRGVHQ